jgi:aminomethyltransferase
MIGQLLATPFHARAVEANRLNAWENRGGFTLASHYGSFEEEALSARFGAVLADLSWHWRAELSGARVEEFVARFFTRNVAALGIGAAMGVLWLNDAGAVRGSGTVLRKDGDCFVLISPQSDRVWLEDAADLFGVDVRDHTKSEGVLSVIGPTAAKVLAGAGLEANLLPLRFVSREWSGISVTLSRLGLGFEVWCAADDALIVWDRLVAAGRGFALMPAGLQALDTLEFESGILCPGRDYHPVRDGFAPQPSPQALGLCALVDEAHHFNGRASYLKSGPATYLSGVLLDGATPVSDGPLLADGRQVGRLFASRFSPALRGAAAFAVIDDSGTRKVLKYGDLLVRAVRLPFLAPPVAEEPTESAQAHV